MAPDESPQRRQKVEDVPCPACLAQPGSLCTGARRGTGTSHVERHRLAKALHDALNGVGEVGSR